MGGVRSSKNLSGSFSSRVEILDDANIVDLDLIDIDEDSLNNSDDAIADPDEHDDAGIFSIANDYTREDENSLAEEEKTLAKEENGLLAVRTRGNVTKKRVSRRVSGGTRSSGPFRASLHR